MATSTSVREFTVVSAESGAETFSFQLRQNITYQDCRHGPRSGPETQELSVERVFAMYVKEERILRYAITNKIGPVGGKPTCLIEAPFLQTACSFIINSKTSPVGGKWRK